MPVSSQVTHLSAVNPPSQATRCPRPLNPSAACYPALTDRALDIKLQTRAELALAHHEGSDGRAVRVGSPGHRSRSQHIERLAPTECIDPTSIPTRPQASSRRALPGTAC